MPQLYVTKKEQQRIAKLRKEKKVKANLSDEEYHSILAMRERMAYVRSQIPIRKEEERLEYCRQEYRKRYPPINIPHINPDPFAFEYEDFSLEQRRAENRPRLDWDYRNNTFVTDYNEHNLFVDALKRGQLEHT